ncbi:acyltransferase family protein [Steroidobacter sp.]|uniref:acyltransferase family protein n=1 Tax=Steroidobacter sp. TaxID=1978227 RepID=UPI001A4D1E21|nr:acyltransferase family protein [Steroidobacter sp.]MBL8264936.1 acyltransferase [Steroidobacter sp.]
MDKQFREDIEGLRAVAVLSVVIFHFGVGGLPGGFIGVDVFFVISGYLISGLLLNELDRTGRIDLWRFYGRRARRLLPLSLLVTVVTLLVAVFILSPSEQLFAAKGGLASSLYASNFFFMTQLADYFAPESELNPFLHTWSLSVEEQFYLVWPALLLLLWRRRPTARSMAISMSVLAVLSFALCLWLSYRKQPWAFYASPTRAWEFLFGALAALKPVTDWARRSRAAVSLGWLGMAGLGATLLLLTEEARFPGWIALVPAVATVAILISGASHQRGGPDAFLKTSVMQWLGKHSYSIYLWHWPIIVYANLLELGDPITRIALCSALTLICAATSFRLVEHPVRASGWLAANPLRSVRLGAALTAAGSVIALSTAQAALVFSARPEHAALIAAMKEMPVASGSSENCLIGFKQSEPVTCNFGSSEARKTVVLFGDSHADQWSTPLALLAEEQGWRLVTLLKASCPVSQITDYSPRLRRLWPECTEWRRRAIEKIIDLDADLVIVSQMSSGYVTGPWSARGKYSASYAQWEQGLKSSLEPLRAANVPVLLLRDSPSPREDLANCVARARWRGIPETSCDVPRSIALDPEISVLERKLATAVGARFADLSAQFCNDELCPAVDSGILVYRDTNHLTNDTAERQVQALRLLLEEHVLVSQNNL